MADQPAGATPPAVPPPVNVREMVKVPAILLMVAAAIGVVFCLLMILLNLLSTGLSAVMGGGEGQVFNFLSGGIGIAFDILGIVLAGFIVYGAMQMKDLKNHTMALLAAIIVMVPFLSPCCVVGLPVGIWALVILVKPEVKAAFAQK